MSLLDNGNVQEMLRGRQVGRPPLMSQAQLRKELASRAKKRRRARRRHGWLSAKLGRPRVGAQVGVAAIFYAWATEVFGCWTRPASSTSRHSDLHRAYPQWVRHLGAQRVGRIAAGIVRHGVHIRRQGYKGQKEIPPPVDVSSPHGKECLAELSKAVAMGAAEWLTPEEVERLLELPASQRFIMPIFCILQNGKLRCCFNAQELNEYAQKIPFKQNTIRELVGMLQHGDFFCAMDIRKYYWSIPLAESDRNLCLFRIRTADGVRWGRMLCCPFGLRDIPKYSTDLLRPVLGYVRETMKTRVAGKIDDYFVVGSCWMDCLRKYHTLTQIIQDLGLELAPEKAQRTIRMRGTVREPTTERAVGGSFHFPPNRWGAPVQLQLGDNEDNRGVWTKLRRWDAERARWTTYIERLPSDSVLTAPTQAGEMLGFQVDTRTMALFVPRRKIVSIREHARAMEKRAERGERFTIRELEQIHGQLVALTPAASGVRMYTAAMRWAITNSLRSNGHDHDARVSLPVRVREDLRELGRDLLWELSGKSLLPFRQDVVIVNDAGPRGLGAMILQTHEMIAQLFEQRLVEASQNMRELMADVRATKSVVLQWNLRDVNILILTDNSTSEAYGNQRFRRQDLAEEAIRFRKFVMGRRILVQFQHLPGVEMLATGVDQASRISHSPAAWTIGDSAFATVLRWLREMCEEFNLPMTNGFSTDMLAEPWNARAKQFVALQNFQVVNQVAVDAMVTSWDRNTVGNMLYVFPPPRLLPSTLERVEDSSADLIVLVTPAWRQSLWWNSVSRAAAGDPLVIEEHEENIAPPGMLSTEFRSLRPVALHVWTFFGGRSELRDTMQKRSKPFLVRTRIERRARSMKDRGHGT